MTVEPKAGVVRTTRPASEPPKQEGTPDPQEELARLQQKYQELTDRVVEVIVSSASENGSLEAVPNVLSKMGIETVTTFEITALVPVQMTFTDVIAANPRAYVNLISQIDPERTNLDLNLVNSEDMKIGSARVHQPDTWAITSVLADGHEVKVETKWSVASTPSPVQGDRTIHREKYPEVELPEGASLVHLNPDKPTVHVVKDFDPKYPSTSLCGYLGQPGGHKLVEINEVDHSVICGRCIRHISQGYITGFVPS